MSSALTTAGQTRINYLQGAGETLDIDRFVLAMIPDQVYTDPVDRSQGMPDAGNIVHTHTLTSMGYVTPDQVVYSMVLGAGVGNFTFNWIGAIEAVTDNVIAIMTIPDTAKWATDLGNNITGNILTRNLAMSWQDAQSLTGITVEAEWWQFDFLTLISGAISTTQNETRKLDPTDTDTVKEKHLSNAQAKVWQDHTVDEDLHKSFVAGDEINLSFVPDAAEMLSRRLLERNGASLLRADFPDLFAKIGTQFGAVDANHFNLMDDRGLFARTWDHGAGVDVGASVSLTGNTLSGSTTISGIANPDQLESGMAVTGGGIPSGATITGIDADANEISISIAASATGSGVSLEFTNRSREDGTHGDIVGSVQQSSMEAHLHGFDDTEASSDAGEGHLVSGLDDAGTQDISGTTTTKTGGLDTVPINRFKWGGIFY